MIHTYIILILFCLLPWGTAAYTQKVNISQPQKLSSRTPKFRILGKNLDGIIVRKYGGEELIDVYDANLKLKYHDKDISQKKLNAQVEQVVLMSRGVMAFYTSYQKGIVYFFASGLNQRYEPTNQIQGLDTTEFDRSLSMDAPQMVQSQDATRTLFYFPIYKGGDLAFIRVVSLDESFNVAHRQTIELDQQDLKFEIDGATISNSGDCFVQLTSLNKDESLQGYTSFKVIRLHAQSTIVQQNIIKLQRRAFGDAFISYDNLNKQLIISGFYTDEIKKTEKASHGFFIVRLDPQNLNEKEQANIAYSADFMHQLTGKEKSKEEKELYTFKIRDVLMRADGGGVIIAESYYKESEEVRMMSGIMNTGFSDYKVINVYHYNDIVAFSINPQNQIDWSTIMRKRQVSENDNGAYSSYAMFNDRASLQFVFMEEIYSRSPVNQYSVYATGETERKMIMQQEEKDIMLIPKLGKQISPSELIIPSYKKNNLRLVKLNY